MRDYPAPVFDDAVDALRRAQKEREVRIEAKRQAVRAAFPEVTGFAEALREEFGDARIIWAAEGNNVIGQVPVEIRMRIEEEYGEINDLNGRK